AALFAERCSGSRVGNHDLVVLGELDIETFSHAAAAAVKWTQANCSPETIAYLGALRPEGPSGIVAIYHASPRDPVWEYVLWPDQASECMDAQARRVSFVGHSHVALFFTDSSGDEVRGAQAGAGTDLDLSQGRWLINPGSAGQPRDGDPRAAWLELDTDSWSATYHRVSYEIERAASAIEAADLPSALARRLYVGQ
ncbi:MAG: metallophosphoesterase family protein, partial [Solirubrobacterales bacterium]